MICPLRFILARCKQSPIGDVAIKICQVSGNAWVSLKQRTFDGLKRIVYGCGGAWSIIHPQCYAV